MESSTHEEMIAEARAALAAATGAANDIAMRLEAAQHELTTSSAAIRSADPDDGGLEALAQRRHTLVARVEALDGRLADARMKVTDAEIALAAAEREQLVEQHAAARTEVLALDERIYELTAQLELDVRAALASLVDVAQREQHLAHRLGVTRTGNVFARLYEERLAVVFRELAVAVDERRHAASRKLLDAQEAARRAHASAQELAAREGMSPAQLAVRDLEQAEQRAGRVVEPARFVAERTLHYESLSVGARVPVQVTLADRETSDAIETNTPTESNETDVDLRTIEADELFQVLPIEELQ